METTNVILEKAKNLVSKYDALKEESVKFITETAKEKGSIILYDKYTDEGDFIDEEEAYETITGASPVITIDQNGVEDVYFVGIKYKETPEDKRTPYHIIFLVAPESNPTYVKEVDFADVFSDSYSSVIDFIIYLLS